MHPTSSLAGNSAVTSAGYRSAAAAVQAQLRGAGPATQVRLAKRTSNLFRTRAPFAGIRLDGAPFSTVLGVDPATRTAEVGGTATYETIVDATLAHGLMPAVVPQLRTITLGGAVTGLGIEATSWRYGLPHESVLALDVLTGTGEVVTATATGEHAELFRMFPNSYGTLGYALRLTVELLPVEPFVHLRHLPVTSGSELAARIAEVCASGEHAGEPVDFVDGTVFSPGEAYLTLGTFTPGAPRTSDYAGRDIYYRSVQRRSEDWLTVRDFLWRWDTDWFWCSRAFGAQHPLVRPLWPRRYKRSDVYWRLVALEQRYGVVRRIDALRGRPRRESVVQDVEVPVEALPACLEGIERITGIRPVWVCPLQLRDGAGWPLYPLDPGRLYVNVGFWSTVALPAGADDGSINRSVEALVAALGGHKSLYSTVHYSPEEFWARYPAAAYAPAKARYDPDGRFPDLYAKTVGRA